MSFLQQNKQIILASSSSVRKQILQDAGLDFQVILPQFDEEKIKSENSHLTIKELAILLACGKALSVSKLYPNAIVIGSDQICEFKNKAINKSNNAQEAKVQLLDFQGAIHYQNNATIIATNNKIIFKKFARTKLKMRAISETQIDTYINADKAWGCAGSYKYESLGKHLFEKISGDYYVVLGLNLQPLLCFLHRKNFIKIN